MKKLLGILTAAAAVLILAVLLWPREAAPVTEPMPEGVNTIYDAEFNFYDHNLGQSFEVTIPKDWAQDPMITCTSYVPEEVKPEHNLLYSYSTDGTFVGTMTLPGYSRPIYWDPGHFGTNYDRNPTGKGPNKAEYYLDSDELFLTIQLMDGSDILGYAVLQQFCEDVEVPWEHVSGATGTWILPLNHRLEVLSAVYFPEVDGQRQDISQEYVDKQMAAIINAAKEELKRE